MSQYEYTDKHNRTLSITGRSVANREYVLLGLEWSDAEGFIHIAHADIPTVAAELLKAAGHDGLADLIGWESAERKLQERRDALAKDLSGDDVLRYEHIRSSLRRAIDRIIELEDGK